MSTPVPSCPPRPGPAVDEEELSRFRAWLVDRGYAERTGKQFASRVRSAYAHGATSPDDVDVVFTGCHRSIRTGTRVALRALDSFRRAGA